MSEMIERVALALSGGDDPASILAIHRSRARAVIEVMREPTQDMCDVGNETAYLCERRSGLRGETYGKDTWQAMIDEALK